MKRRRQRLSVYGVNSVRVTKLYSLLLNGKCVITIPPGPCPPPLPLLPLHTFYLLTGRE